MELPRLQKTKTQTASQSSSASPQKLERAEGGRVLSDTNIIWRPSMVAKSVIMLAALGTRTSAFFVPGLSRIGPWTGVRRVTAASRTRVGRLLAVDATAAEALPSVAEVAASEALSVKSTFLQTLVERGFYHQCTNVKGLDHKLCTGEVVKAYLGFDATADRCVHDNKCNASV